MSSASFCLNHLISFASITLYHTLYVPYDFKKHNLPSIVSATCSETQQGCLFSISGQSSSSGIYQVLPTSFIRTSPSFLTPHFLPERNFPWHAWLLKSLSLSFPIILTQLWWSLILLYRRQDAKFKSFLYVSCRMWMDIFTCQGEQFCFHPEVEWWVRINL